jgi:hypothetical protein
VLLLCRNLRGVALNIQREAIAQDDLDKDDEVSTAVSMCYLIARQRIRLVRLAAEKDDETKADVSAEESDCECNTEASLAELIYSGIVV